MKQINRPCVEAQLQLENRKMQMDCVKHLICPYCGSDMHTVWVGQELDEADPYCKECTVFFDSFARFFNPYRKDNRP